MLEKQPILPATEMAENSTNSATYQPYLLVVRQLQESAAVLQGKTCTSWPLGDDSPLQPTVKSIKTRGSFLPTCLASLLRRPEFDGYEGQAVCLRPAELSHRTKEDEDNEGSAAP
jgi:hypothetical protein